MRTVLHPRLIVLSVCMIWLGCFQSPDYRYSLFIIRHSLFTENNGSSNTKEAAPRRVFRMLGELRQPSPEGNASGRCPQGFSIGRSDLTEAAISGVYYEKWGSSAHRTRREMPAGAARTEGIASAGSAPPPQNICAFVVCFAQILLHFFPVCDILIVRQRAVWKYNKKGWDFRCFFCMSLNGSRRKRS